MNRSLNRPDLHRPVNNAIPVQKMQYRRAHAAPFASLISGREKYKP